MTAFINFIKFRLTAGKCWFLFWKSFERRRPYRRFAIALARRVDRNLPSGDWLTSDLFGTSNFRHRYHHGDGAADFHIIVLPI